MAVDLKFHVKKDVHLNSDLTLHRWVNMCFGVRWGSDPLKMSLLKWIANNLQDPNPDLKGPCMDLRRPFLV